MSKFYSINEIADQAQRAKYVAAEIIDASGRKVMGGHNVKENPVKWLKSTVKNYLDMPNRTPGVYYVNMYFTANKKTAPDQYPIKVGNLPMSEAPPPVPVIQVMAPTKEPKDNPLDWNAALNYQEQISTLKSQLTAAQLENAALKQKIEDLENEADDDAPGLGENLQTFFKDAILPGVNMFFENQKKNRELQFVQMAQANPNLWYTPQGMEILTGRPYTPGQQPGMPQMPMQPVPQPQAQAPQPDINTQLINAFFESVPLEIYNRIDAMKQPGDTMQIFLQRIADNDAELYAQMVNYVNSNGGAL